MTHSVSNIRFLYKNSKFFETPKLVKLKETFAPYRECKQTFAKFFAFRGSWQLRHFEILFENPENPLKFVAKKGFTK